ncbi:hypothetical protein HMPREF9013_0465 [Bulleidia extructa W1219]|jgi:hypothetical protein|uniref:Carrier domain-containing protein n=1 Tax=Bulleidia extructa W1219 TaxID=679192 RepID=D2MQB5_9FIRM|nr:phosphopantetheine-binding protein [Bulleidia extructa]EFC05184.1 hypothetical protein HMPREF9013_0465 [Bulleidia extructa W1219]
MEELINLLKEEVRDDVDYETEEFLIDHQVFDSFDILQTISALNDHYDISIPATEIVNENFNSAKALLALVNRLKSE